MIDRIPKSVTGELVDNNQVKPLFFRMEVEGPFTHPVAIVPLLVGRGSSTHSRPVVLSSDDLLSLAELQYTPANDPILGLTKGVGIDFPARPLSPPDSPRERRAYDDTDNDLQPPIEADPSKMSQPSREEIDAKFQAVEARMDARVAEATSKLDSLISKMEARDAVMEARAALHDTQFAHITEKLNSLSGLRSVIVTTVIGTGIGIVGLVYAMMSGMSSSFDSGRDTAQLTASAQLAAEKAQAAAEKSASATDAAMRAINFAITEAENKRNAARAPTDEPKPSPSETSGEVKKH